MSVLAVNPLKNAIEGELKAPPSKYHTHRGLILGALANGVSQVTGISKSLDNLSTLQCLSLLGATFEPLENGYKITGKPFTAAENILDCGNSGSTIHFLLGLAATAPGMTVFTGDDSLRSRPLGPYIETLNRWGVDVKSTRGNGYLPVVVNHTDVSKLPEQVEVNGLVSPWATGLVLLAPFCGRDVTVTIENGKLNEGSYTELMIKMMADFGVRVEYPANRSSFFIPGGQQYKPAEVVIPGDIALASFGLVLAAITGSHIRYTNLDLSVYHPEAAILDALQRVGADVRIDAQAKTVEVFGGKPLKGIVIDCNDSPDMVPILSILLAHCEGESRIINAEQLRYKECDRLMAMGQLNKMGASVTETPDGLIIQGSKKLHGAEVESFHDHRVLMSFVVAGLAADSPSYITDPGAAAVSYPGFLKDIEKLGASFAEAQERK
jgi:3-phosphoshikimate 1-carboxyvinyltransferase